MDEREKAIKQRFDLLTKELNERTRRLFAAAEAIILGRGGIAIVSRATGLSRKAISLGIKQLQEEASISSGRIRRVGGGRKKTVTKDLSLSEDLEGLVEPMTRGDPESPLRWTCKSVRKLAAELNRQGHQVSHQLPRYAQPDADAIENLSMAIVVDQQHLGGGSHSTAGTITDIYSVLRLLYSRIGQPFVGYTNAFSFNDPQGMCPECNGIGRKIGVDLDTFLDTSKSLNDGAILFPEYAVESWGWIPPPLWCRRSGGKLGEYSNKNERGEPLCSNIHPNFSYLELALSPVVPSPNNTCSLEFSLASKF